MINFGAYRKVVISELVRSSLKIFGTSSNILGNLVVLLGEAAHLVAEFGGLAATFNLDLSSDRPELIDVPRANLFFNS